MIGRFFDSVAKALARRQVQKVCPQPQREVDVEGLGKLSLVRNEWEGSLSIGAFANLGVSVEASGPELPDESVEVLHRVLTSLEQLSEKCRQYYISQEFDKTREQWGQDIRLSAVSITHSDPSEDFSLWFECDGWDDAGWTVGFRNNEIVSNLFFD